MRRGGRLGFLSSEPRVRLTKAFTTPFRNVVATARTCYSSRGIIEDEEVGGPEKFTPLARSIYEAGHHTTFQHAHFQFAIENVSRQFIWSFLHAHPFYNSEQVSQRYVAVKPDTVTVPELPGDQLAVYRGCVEQMFEGYRRLCELLDGPVRSEFYKRFNRSERMAKAHDRQIGKKAQEAARYVLPVGTQAYLYHTVSGVVLLRYWRMCGQRDVPSEQRLVVEKMVEELLAFDREYETTLEGPLEEEFPEEEVLAVGSEERAEAFCGEFDGEQGVYTSRLVGATPEAGRVVAQAVREILGVPRVTLGDEEAIALALDPGRNRLLGESLNVTTMHKLSRALHHAQFTFRKRLSHAADSQDQRHRMTPGSRPYLGAHLRVAPDYVTPAPVGIDEGALAVYTEVMERTWEAIGRLRRMGAPEEALLYLLPNAAVVRFTESADLLNLRHKHEMRLCYNAQEEIWQASVEEARQVREVAPELGRWLLPPCGVRLRARQKPICPEGNRYCGVRVWKLELEEYERVI